VVLNGFLDLFTGTADVASVSGINLQAFSLAQIKQMTEQINKNMTTLMEADGKASWDHFKRGEFNEAHVSAIKGFHAAPNKIETGVPMKLMCTRIKLMTELIREGDAKEGQLLAERSKKTGSILQTCLDDLLDDPLVKDLWERATSLTTLIKYPSLHLIAQIDDLVGGCYLTMSRCLGWTFPDQLPKDGDIAELHTKYLPTGKENRITIPLSQHKESVASMKVFKKIDKQLCMKMIVTNNQQGKHRTNKLIEPKVNPKPSKWSIWTVNLEKNKYSLLKRTFSALNAEHPSIYLTENVLEQVDDTFDEKVELSILTDADIEGKESKDTSEKETLETTAQVTKETKENEYEDTDQKGGKKKEEEKAIEATEAREPEVSNCFLEDNLVNRWSEKTISDITSNLSIDNVPAYIEIMKEILDMENSSKFKAFSQMITDLAKKCNNEHKSKVVCLEHTSVVSGNSSIFAYLYCKKEKKGVISLAYAIHIMLFEMERGDIESIIKDKESYQKETACMIHDVSKGIPKNKIEEYGNNLMECLDLEPKSPEARKLKANLKHIRWTQCHQCSRCHGNRLQHE
jgi:hypothetical protein